MFLILGDGRLKPKKDQGEESFVDPKTGKTHVIRWTVEESTEPKGNLSAPATIASTGVVALWRAITCGASMLYFRICVVGQVALFLLGWFTAPFYAHPLANAVGYYLIASVSLIGIIRLVRLVHTTYDEQEADRRLLAANTIGFIICLFLVSYFYSFLILNWMPRVRLN